MIRGDRSSKGHRRNKATARVDFPDPVRPTTAKRSSKPWFGWNWRQGLPSHVYVYAYLHMAGCQSVGSWVQPYYPISNGARFTSILWAHHAFILAKSRIKYILCGRRSSEDTFAGFAAISAATAVELGTFRLHSSWMFLEPHVIQLRHITVPAQSRGEFGTLWNGIDLETIVFRPFCASERTQSSKPKEDQVDISRTPAAHLNTQLKGVGGLVNESSERTSRALSHYLKGDCHNGTTLVYLHSVVAGLSCHTYPYHTSYFCLRDWSNNPSYRM